jgi:perosamine synthetase
MPPKAVTHYRGGWSFKSAEISLLLKKSTVRKVKLPSFARRIALNFIRQAFSVANIDPAFVKALIRKPAFVHGGPRARRMPWPRRQHFDGREKRAVIRLMNREIRKGGAIIYGGLEEKAYCDAFAKYLGGGYAKAVNSGTNALYVALRALDLKPGSEVVVPPITDAGGTMPVALLNCIPIPADSEKGSLNTSAEEIKRVISRRTSAIVVAHISGHPVDMDPILELGAELDVPVIEDCAQAHGALYKGRMVGTFGAIAAFSTMFGKQHCTGAQGGVVFTKQTLLFARIRQISDRGKPYGAIGNPANLVASLNFNQNEIGMAIGRVQLEKLPAALQARRSFVTHVQNELEELAGVSLIADVPGCSGSYWFVMLRLDTSKLSCDSQEFATSLAQEGIGGVSAGYPFIPTDQPWHQNAFGSTLLPWSPMPGSRQPRHFPLSNAHDANRTIVRVDVHESLGNREARDLARAIKKVARHYRIAAQPISISDAAGVLAPPSEVPLSLTLW